MKYAQLLRTITSLAANFLGLRGARTVQTVHSVPEKISINAVVVPRVPRRIVRVIRVNEPGMAAGTAGRMVISGRFADVCAELDRLAA